MKKILLTLVVFTIITPSIALAAWWNPVSWFDNWGFIFNRKTEKTETLLLKEKIKELESNLEKQPEIDSESEPQEKNIIEKSVPVKTEQKIQEEVKNIIPTQVHENVSAELREVTDILVERFNQHIETVKKDIVYFSDYKTDADLTEIKRILRTHLTFLETSKSATLSLKAKASSGLIAEAEYKNQLMALGQDFTVKASTFNIEFEAESKSSLKEYADKLDSQADGLKNQIDSYSDQAAQDAQARQDLYNSIVGQGRGIPESIINEQLRQAGF